MAIGGNMLDHWSPRDILHAITNLSRERREIVFPGTIVYVDAERTLEPYELEIVEMVYVICESEAWKFFRKRFDNDEIVQHDRYRFKVREHTYKFIALTPDLEQLRGTQFDKVILYSVFLDRKQYAIIQTCFRDRPIKIETIID
jgi:hypothetical protein